MPTVGRASKCSVAHHEITLLSLTSLSHRRPKSERELGLVHKPLYRDQPRKLDTIRLDTIALDIGLDTIALDTVVCSAA